MSRTEQLTLFTGSHEITLPEGLKKVRVLLRGPGTCSLEVDGIPIWAAIANSRHTFETEGSVLTMRASRKDDRWGVGIKLKMMQGSEPLDDEAPYIRPRKKSMMARIRDQVRVNAGLTREAFETAEELGMMAYDIEDLEHEPLWEDDPDPELDELESRSGGGDEPPEAENPGDENGTSGSESSSEAT